MNKRGKMTQSNTSPRSSCSRMKEKHREPEVPEEKSPIGRMSRWSCKDYLKGTCTTPSCEKWHPPECLFYKTKSGCRFGDKCSYSHRHVDEQPSKRSRKHGDKSAVAMFKQSEHCYRTGRPVLDAYSSNTRQLVAYSRIWSRRGCYGRAQTYGNRSDV